MQQCFQLNSMNLLSFIEFIYFSLNAFSHMLHIWCTWERANTLVRRFISDHFKVIIFLSVRFRFSYQIVLDDYSFISDRFRCLQSHQINLDVYSFISNRFRCYSFISDHFRCYRFISDRFRCYSFISNRFIDKKKNARK